MIKNLILHKNLILRKNLIKNQKVKKNKKKKDKQDDNKVDNAFCINKLELSVLYISEWKAIVNLIFNTTLSIKLENIDYNIEYTINLLNKYGEKHTEVKGYYYNKDIFIKLQPGYNYLEISIKLKTQQIILLPSQEPYINVDNISQVSYDDDYLFQDRYDSSCQDQSDSDNEIRSQISYDNLVPSDSDIDNKSQSI
jgi:hypothetical protein